MNSCIEGEEEVWVEADGSGRAELEISAPTLLFAKFGGVESIVAQARAGMAESESVELEELTMSERRGKTTLKAKVSFPDARKMGNTLKSFRDPARPLEPCEQEIIFGETSVEVSFPRIQFRREVDIRSLLPPEASNPTALSLLGDSQLTYRIHLPDPATSNNADTVSEDGRTLEWQIPVAQMMAQPVTMEFTAPIPRLPSYLALTGLVLLFLVGSGILYLRLRKRRPIPTSKSE